MQSTTWSPITAHHSGSHTHGSRPLRRGLVTLLLVLLSLPATAPAGDSGTWTDLRDQGETSLEAFAAALFPAALPSVRTRGIGRIPASPTVPGPQATVVLNVYFASNSATIPSGAYREIDKLGTILSAPEHRTARVELAGHTDSQGDAQKNHALSERRVQQMKAYLVRHFHLAPERLMAVGYGATKPIASNDTPEGRRQNRRVEIVNLGASGV